MTVVGSIEPGGSEWNYFLGGVPPLSYFDIECHEIEAIIKADAEPEEGLGFASALGLIGLVAYFEGFWRALFSAAINICPPILEHFVEARPEFAVPLRDLIHAQSPAAPYIGFIVGERLDFGSAKAVNGAFVNLLRVSPFTKSDASDFDRLSRIRNVLVHYGGVETLKYTGADHERLKLERRLFYDSVSVKKTDALLWSSFLKRVAVKASRATYDALGEYIVARQLEATVGARKARDLLVERLWATE